MQHFHVTAENFDNAQADMAASDQRRELKPGCETWGILYQPGSQRGQITVWPDTGRAAICFGGDSLWGDWDPNARTIILEDVDENQRPIVYDENGDRVPADQNCD